MRITPFDKTKFIGWDCEGINDGFIDEWTERQKLVLISLSTGDYLYNENGIPQNERFEFIDKYARLFPSNQYKHVFFGGSYDFNKILEGIPLSKMKRIHKTKFWTIYREWAIRYRPRKELTLAHLKDHYSFNAKVQMNQQCDSYIRFWDVIGFFQSSFLNVIKQWLGEDYPDYDLIASGKQARLAFNGDDREFMLAYNHAETKALVCVMEKLHEQLRKVDLKVARWDGAGAVAGQIFRRHGLIKSYFIINGKAKTKIELPAEINEATRYAYFGGRIESAYIGRYQGKVYNYDINSAYPYAASLLPNLNFGQWVHYGELNESEIEKKNPLSVFRIQYDFHADRLYYPFPQRCTDGSVIFPRNGERWIFYHELMAAIRSLKPFDKIKVWECWEFQSDGQPSNSFEIVEQLYRERQRLVSIHDPAEKVLKLGLNSIYGKLCQKLGWNEKTGQSPAFHFLLFAAWITSFVRAKIYDVVRQSQESVISINTDGIISTEPLAIRVSAEKEFGGWSLETSDEIVQLQSGVYWIRKGDEWKERARGLGRVTGEGETELERMLSRNDKVKKRLATVLDGWDSGKTKIHFPIKLFVTSKKAAISEDWFSRWGHWYIMHDEKTGELGRSLDLKCSGWGKRRLRESPKSNRLVTTVAAENIEYGGRFGINNPDLGAPYDLPWISAKLNDEKISDDFDDMQEIEIIE